MSLRDPGVLETNALMSEVILRAVIERDAEAIAAIYNHYIINTVVTFEEQAVKQPRRCLQEQSA
jgi:hypothetical protein